MGGGHSAMQRLPITTENVQVQAKDIHSRQFLEIERFAMDTYLNWSSNDGLKIIFANPCARRVFITFLNTQSSTKYIIIFSNLEKLLLKRTTTVIDVQQSSADNYDEQMLNLNATCNIDEPVDSSENIAHILSAVDTQRPSIIVHQLLQALHLTPPTNEIDDDFLITSIFDIIDETTKFELRHAFISFIGSDDYKEWRKKEGKCQEYIQKSTNSNSFVPTTSEALIPTTSTTTTFRRNFYKRYNIAFDESFTNQAVQFLHHSYIDRVFGHGSWIGAFIAVAEALPICVTLSDANPQNPGFPLIYINKMFETITGYQRERIRGTNCRFLQGPKTEPESISIISNSLKAALPVRVTITNYRSNGKQFVNLLTMKPIFDLDGQYCFVCGVQFDITCPEVCSKALVMVNCFINTIPNVISCRGVM